MADTNTNYDQYFEDEDTRSIGSATSAVSVGVIDGSTIAPATVHGNAINDKCHCTGLLKVLLKKTDAIADHLIKLDVKVKFATKDSTPSTRKLGVVNIDTLKNFGLPIEKESELENLEKRIKTDMEFKTNLVS